MHVHPRQSDWYRRDKGFGMMAQVQISYCFFIRFFILNNFKVICGHDGTVFQIDLLTGHNNDAGALNITNMKEFLSEHNIKLLADLGYSRHTLVTPSVGNPVEWQNTQKGLRAVVETVIGMAKFFSVASDTFRGFPELHAIGVMVVWQLVAIRLKEYPLRRVELTHVAYK